MPLILAWYPCVEGSYMSTNPTRNRNNEFILDNLYCAKNMADFERRQLEIRLEFVRWSFTERNNSSEGSFEPKKDPIINYTVISNRWLYRYRQIICQSYRVPFISRYIDISLYIAAALITLYACTVVIKSNLPYHAHFSCVYAHGTWVPRTSDRMHRDNSIIFSMLGRKMVGTKQQLDNGWI